jgi:hypothetical protein
MKKQSMSIKEFMEGEHKRPNINKKAIIKVTVLTAAVLVISVDPVLASSTGIDEKARELYFDKLLVFGKWAIILKGGWDTINKALKEDFDGAKKGFFSYLIIYLILWGLPWGLDQVEDVFA